jgi:hypothetical protein
VAGGTRPWPPAVHAAAAGGHRRDKALAAHSERELEEREAPGGLDLASGGSPPGDAGQAVKGGADQEAGCFCP